jgi:hypothetical protein
MARIEQLVMTSGLDWPIVWLSGLFETPDATLYQVAEGHIRRRFISRLDLADFMLQELAADRFVYKTRQWSRSRCGPGCSISWRERRFSSGPPSTSFPIGERVSVYPWQ